jgi:PIN like domain
MAPRRRTSRKRSAASSIAKRLESAVFYLDESIYSRILSDGLISAGVGVKRPGIDIPFGTQDEVWLTTAGAQGWIVLMRDQRVKHRTLEIQSLRDARVGAFVLTAGRATAQSTAVVILSKLQKIVNISRSERKPFLYTLGITGGLSKVKIR